MPKIHDGAFDHGHLHVNRFSEAHWIPDAASQAAWKDRKRPEQRQWLIDKLTAVKALCEQHGATRIVVHYDGLEAGAEDVVDWDGKDTVRSPRG